MDHGMKAAELFVGGYNCAQSVAVAFCDVTGLDEKFTARMVSSFGGGMGRMREVCGAVSGMAMVASGLSPAADPKNMTERQQNYALVQRFADSFRRENGDIVCRRLLGLEPRQEAAETTMPSERTAEYYKKRPCVEYVATAARIVALYINEESL